MTPPPIPPLSKDDERIRLTRRHHKEKGTPCPDGYQLAKVLVIKKQTTNVSRIQRYLHAPYEVAHGYLMNMEAAGLVSRPNGKGKRAILIKWADYKGPGE